jgi:hypothetical protein
MNHGWNPNSGDTDVGAILPSLMSTRVYAKTVLVTIQQVR